MGIRGLRNGAIVTFFVSMAILLVGGYFAVDKVPPVPAKVVSGQTAVTDQATIMRGQDTYQRYGLMDHGSVWGHGSLRGMDFAAHTLHMVGQHMRDFTAAGGQPQAGAYAGLPDAKKRETDATVIHEMRTNRYSDGSKTLELTPAQAYGLEQIRAYWEKEFAQGDTHYGFLPNTVPTAQERKDIADFFFWTAWAAGTPRPGLSYTLHEQLAAGPLRGQHRLHRGARSGASASILALLAVLGIVVYVVHRYGFFYGEAKAVEAAYRLLEAPVTPSQRSAQSSSWWPGCCSSCRSSTAACWPTTPCIPGTFYIKFIGEIYPYSWAKTWHLQLAILWIAVSWMGTAIYLAPLVAGREPKGQRLLVNILFVAAVAVTVGQPAGRGAGHQGLPGRRLVLAGPSGLGVSGAGPALADPAVRRADLLAGGGLSRYRARAEGRRRRNRGGRRSAGARHVLRLQRHLRRRFLRLRPVLRPRHAPDHRRLLALVRGAHLGGEHLRVLRRGRDLAVPGDAGAGDGQVGACAWRTSRPSWSSSAASRARRTTTSGTAARASGWPSAACSARWSRSR